MGTQVKLSMRYVRGRYSRFRKKYFLPVCPEFPTLDQVRFRWQDPKKLAGSGPDKELATVHKVEIPGMGIPLMYAITISTVLQGQPRLLDIMLVHEMVHIYQWVLGADNTAEHGKFFDVEADRLGALGFLREVL
jgi:hypothetical protein